jgi:WD40 repeat protein
VQKICFGTRNIIAIVLENCCVQFYCLSLYEGVFLKEFTNIHMEQITQFLTTRNYKYLISGGAEGMIKIWDTKMLFRNYTSYQQFIGHPNSIKALICLEQKSLLVTTSENSGIFFWNYLGDLTFTETEINSELERLGNLKESGKEALGKLRNSRSLTAFSSANKFKKQQQHQQQIGEHLDKIYNANNSANVNFANIKTESSVGGEKNSNSVNNFGNVNNVNEKRLKIDLNNYSADALKFLNMLPVEFDRDDKDNLPTEISQSLLLNSNSFNRYFTREEMYNILLFKAKYVPEKIDRL